jgi:formamidopyrimidine-DNA glycosylase
LVGRVIKSVTAKDDSLIFANPLTSESFVNTLENRKVTSVSQHGKYFWAQLDNDKFVLLHFGMTGWIHVKGKKTHFIVMENGGDKKAKERLAQLADSKSTKSVNSDNMGEEDDPDMVWPPKFDKFILTTDSDQQLAFTDPRRLGRVRIIDAKNEDELMKLEPLRKNGLDFSKPDGRWDQDTFAAEVSRRKVPVKSLLLDQALFAGVGNWIADEILYQARIQ